jgi:hypothetical protein
MFRKENFAAVGAAAGGCAAGGADALSTPSPAMARKARRKRWDQRGTRPKKDNKQEAPASARPNAQDSPPPGSAGSECADGEVPDRFGSDSGPPFVSEGVEGALLSGGDTQEGGSASTRRRFFAVLGWSTDYRPLLEAEREANSTLVNELGLVHLSTYSLNAIRRGGATGKRIAEAAASRLSDIVGFLDRSRNVHIVPISQER